MTPLMEDDGNKVDQVFFHDPDGYMIEICNCENIPIVPLSSCIFRPRMGSFKRATPNRYGFMETVMMESLSMDMMNFSFGFINLKMSFKNNLSFCFFHPVNKNQFIHVVKQLHAFLQGLNYVYKYIC